MSLEERRKASYKRLCTKRKRMNEAHRAFAEARAEYHRELEAYSKIDREIAQENATVLPTVEEPKPKRKKRNNNKNKDLINKAKELFKDLPKEDKERLLAKIREE